MKKKSVKNKALEQNKQSNKQSKKSKIMDKNKNDKDENKKHPLPLLHFKVKIKEAAEKVTQRSALYQAAATHQKKAPDLKAA